MVFALLSQPEMSNPIDTVALTHGLDTIGIFCIRGHLTKRTFMYVCRESM
jgi:hypothetical protein